jgi:hypothetical protein
MVQRTIKKIILHQVYKIKHIVINLEEFTSISGRKLPSEGNNYLINFLKINFL